MYRILYNDSIIFDPYGNDNEVVTDASMSVEINAAAYMDFTMSRRHPLYNTIAERDGVVTLYWDGDILFQGVIESIDMDINGNKSISCVSALDYLNDTVVRPYSTVAGEQELTAPSSVNGYFQWLIDQHNKHVLDSRKRFYVGVNQGEDLQWHNFIYRSSTNNPTTASEISDQLLGTLGGYLIMKYVDGRYVLNLYSRLNTVNSQIIDFGVNITDFSKTVDTKDQYTALILKGGSPEFKGGSFESGDWSHWITHPNEPLVGDKTHGGYLSSFFVSGIGEYVNDSFFYFRRGRRYRSTVYVKNERESDVTIHGSYQYEQSGMWTTVDSGTSLVVKNEGDNWTEFTFDFMPDISEYSKIRPRWYFDNVSNDGNRRVYLDDFSFSQVIGDTDVSEDPINVSMVPDGGTQYDSNILKTGDVIYDPSSVLRYGYKEKVYEDSTITNVNDLLQAGIKALIKLKSPQISLDIKAVDLSMFMKEYTHLNVGDIVRVRSAIHGIDEYLMVNSIKLDLQDPGQSEYSIGKVYDSLTGQQSGIIRSLNSGINSSLDSIVSLDKTTKDQAVQISSTQQAADQAQNTATNAQSTADNAQQMSNANKEAIDSVKSNQTEYENQLKQVQKDLDDRSKDIAAVDRRVDNVSLNLASTQSDLAELKIVVSNTTDKADQALQTANSVKTELETNYSATDKIAKKYSTKSEVANTYLAKSDASNTYLTKSDASNTYLTKSDASNAYATKSMVEQTSQSITSSVEATYATKATVESLENIANNAVQTWMSSGVPMLSNKPASDWMTSELKSQHSGDIYYDSDTGYSYRFGSSDGQNYSWALVKDTDITKAIADAAKAQQTANGAQSGVDELKTSIPETYATKTELTQKADSITTRVEEVAQAGETTSNKVSAVEKSLESFKTTVSETYETKTDALNKQSTLNQTINGFRTDVSQTYATKTSLNTLSNEADITYPIAALDNTFNYWIRLGTATISEQGRITQLTINAYKGNDGNNGNNGNPNQNANVIIQIRRGWNGGDANHQFNVIVDNSNWKEILVKAISNETNKVTIWIYNSIASYLRGNYTVSGWRNSWEDQGLTQTAAPTGTEQQVTASKTYATMSDFNNLQISGGRNIARDTKAFGRNNVTNKDSGYLRFYVNRTNGTYNGCTVRSLTSSDPINQTIFEYGVNNVNIGEYYTMSFWAKGSGTMRLYCYGPIGYIRAARIAASDGQSASASYNDGATDMTLSSEWKRYWVVWQLNDNPPVGYSTSKYFLLRNNNNMESCDVCGVMIEKGNKPSEWSPASEDILSKNEADETYSTKNDVGVLNLLKNGDFSSGMSNWFTDGGTSSISDGTYGKRLNFTQTGTNNTKMVYNKSYNHIIGQAYEVSFYAFADEVSTWHFGPYISHLSGSVNLTTSMRQYTLSYQAELANNFSIWSDNPTATIHIEQVKLSMAPGVVRSRAMKRIWSGNVNQGGNFTCSEAPYYNVFAARLDADSTLMLGIRSELNSSSGSITLLGTDPTAGSYQGLRTCSLTFSNETSVTVTDIKVGTSNDSSKPLTELWGIL